MSGAHSFSHGWKTGYTAATLLSIFLISAPTWSADNSAPLADTETAVTEKTNSATQKNISGRVARAIFTTAIVDREPVDDLKILSSNTGRVYFFSDLRELAGQIVTHRWEYNGQLMAEVTFKVGSGARWRVYSSKNLLPEWTGVWTVRVNNESGQTLRSSSFEYITTPATK